MTVETEVHVKASPTNLIDFRERINFSISVAFPVKPARRLSPKQNTARNSTIESKFLVLYFICSFSRKIQLLHLAASVEFNFFISNSILFVSISMKTERLSKYFSDYNLVRLSFAKKTTQILVSQGNRM